MDVKSLQLQRDFEGNPQALITFPRGTESAVQQIFSKFQETAEKKRWVCEIQPVRKKRSLDANAYCFVLCDKIAQKILSTKEKVYQDAIREVGVFDHLLIQDKAVESFIAIWNKKGLGDFAEITHKSKAVEGCTAIIAYHGSSVYDTKEMSILIDYIVGEAKALEIETMAPEELEAMKNNWKGG